jgi:hypothetical protein
MYITRRRCRNLRMYKGCLTNVIVCRDTLASSRQNVRVRWFQNAWGCSSHRTSVFRSRLLHWRPKEQPEEEKKCNNLVILANIRHRFLRTCVSVLLEEKICLATCVMMSGSGHLHNCSTDKVQGHRKHFLDPTREWYRWLFWFYMRNSFCIIQLISLGQSKQKYEIGGTWEETRNTY